MKSALLLLAMLAISCTEGKKTAADMATGALSAAVVKHLECANADAVRADVKVQVDKVLKVEAETQGSVVSKFCGDIVTLAVPGLVDAGIPDSWGCTATDAKEKLVSLASKACDNL